MAKVKCEVGYTTDYDDNGHEHDCVVVTCLKCGHSTTSWGDTQRSVNRCLAMLSEECPEAESNFYVEE